jgi:hypothetical protein
LTTFFKKTWKFPNKKSIFDVNLVFTTTLTKRALFITKKGTFSPLKKFGGDVPPVPSPRFLRPCKSVGLKYACAWNIAEQYFDIISLNETMLDSSISDHEIKINGYDIVRKDRNRHGGGETISPMKVLSHLKLRSRKPDHFYSLSQKKVPSIEIILLL